MRFAVGEDERAHAIGIPSREDLCNRATRVVRDEIDLVQLERIAEREQPVGERAQREVLVRGRGALAVQRQVEGDRAPRAVQRGDHVVPQVHVGADTVHEHGGNAAPDVDVAHCAGTGLHSVAVVIEVVDVHHSTCFRVDRGAGPAGRAGGYGEQGLQTDCWSRLAYRLSVCQGEAG